MALVLLGLYLVQEEPHSLQLIRSLPWGCRRLFRWVRLHWKDANGLEYPILGNVALLKAA